MANAKIIANEKTNAQAAGWIVDKDDYGLPRSVLDVLLITIYLASDRKLRIRSSDDLLTDPHFSLDEDGAFVWDIQPYETEIMQPSEVGIGSPENHVAVFEFAWQSPRTGSLNDPFTTVEGSKFITVTTAGHGLLPRDNVYFLPKIDVAGLDIGGHYIVRKVLDASRYTIEHFDAADATVSGAGGVVVWYANGFANSGAIDMQITRRDPV